MKFIIGIDGGGTKTVGQIINLSNFQSFSATTGPSSLSQGIDKASETLSLLIINLIQQAETDSSNVRIAIGVAGAGNSRLVDRCHEYLVRQTGINSIVIVEDCETALLGAKCESLINSSADSGSGNDFSAFVRKLKQSQLVNDKAPQTNDVALITLGTGSFVAHSDNNKNIFSGGWGFPIGDEGSGAKLGFYLVNHFLKMWDANQVQGPEFHKLNQDPLYTKLAMQLGATKEQLLQWLSEASQSDFASLAPAVFEYASSSKLAALAIHQHLNDVADLLNSIKSSKIFFTGGLASSTLEHLLANNLIPNIAQRIKLIDSPSLMGALSMADSLSDANIEQPQTREKVNNNLTSLDKLVSEQRNSASTQLDLMSSHQIVALMNDQDSIVPQAIETVSQHIAEAIDTITHSLNNGGRLIYMGAGTSGRLGVLDAVECPPTFSTDPNTVIGLLAGGQGAMFKAVEGAEDSTELGQKDLIDLNLAIPDVVVGIAASGRTPYVIGGLNYAKSLGCKTISVTCNPVATINDIADIPIAVNLGPEILSGSTRLKAGSAQKMIINMLSTGAMVQLGKCYENLMVDVKASNHKLVKRACRIIEQACGISFEQAEQLLVGAQNNVKLAILMQKSGLDQAQAAQYLANHNGFLRRALNNL
ncbi:N-acetylmuramic acid 6-phosphate etherase [Psychrosphaera aestuarii]|uniref:N-acetylmuramic acid 6-phosphate etherase n=1 Tax=Psychrosphaera aestuarii TaxID=1266052 RepID=UPI001B343205